MRRSKNQFKMDVALEVFSQIKKTAFEKSGICPEDFHYILPSGGLGEHVFTLSQLHHLRAEGKVCVLLRNDRAYFARLWPYAADLFIDITPETFNLLMSLLDISFRNKGWLYICAADLVADGRMGLDLVIKNNRLTLKELYSYALGLDLKVPVLAPVVQDRYFHSDQGLSKKVLILAHAKSMLRIPQPFWMALFKELEDRGYEIIVDLTADDDVVPYSSPRVHFMRTQVDHLAGLARCVDAVITLRSGLADLLGGCIAGTDVKLFVLYHVTSGLDDTPNAPHHQAGVHASGLNLGRIYNSENIYDLEIHSDSGEDFLVGEVGQILDRLPALVQS